MTDKELLEYAAKAAGIYLYCYNNSYITNESADSPVYWNPLTDDDDALRLAVKLDFAISNWKGNSWVSPSSEPNEPYCFEPHNGDNLQSTRRAIVRAAAEIGKEMK